MTFDHSLAGGCHCGAIRYQFATNVAPESFALRRCACSYCVKQGNRYVSDPLGELMLFPLQEEKVLRYRFGSKTAEFLVCKECGVNPVVLSHIDDQLLAVVNANTLDAADRLPDIISVGDYKGESLEERLARRKKNWIGTVILQH